jgi:hypothetical protein
MKKIFLFALGLLLAVIVPLAVRSQGYDKLSK